MERAILFEVWSGWRLRTKAVSTPVFRSFGFEARSFGNSREGFKSSRPKGRV